MSMPANRVEQPPHDHAQVKWFNAANVSPPPECCVLAWVSHHTHPIVVHVAVGGQMWIRSGFNIEAPYVLRWSWLPESPS